MSRQLPSREQALALLRQSHCSSGVIAHCKAVAKLALETAEACKKRGFDVDLGVVEAGALLHDIGRSKTHSVDHVIAGAEIAKAEGVPDAVVAVIERHLGGGITAAEAEEFGWPEGNYIPITLEEKIVSYADKLVETSKRVPIDLTINQLREKNLFAAAERVKRIHEEVTRLIGETS